MVSDRSADPDLLQGAVGNDTYDNQRSQRCSSEQHQFSFQFHICRADHLNSPDTPRSIPTSSTLPESLPPPTGARPTAASAVSSEVHTFSVSSTCIKPDSSLWTPVISCRIFTLKVCGGSSNVVSSTSTTSPMLSTSKLTGPS